MKVSDLIETIKAKGEMLDLGGGSISSIASDSWILFDGSHGKEKFTIKLTKQKDQQAFYFDCDSFDHTEKTIAGVVAFLNKYKAKYVGIDERE
jgi:hypothetical protein